MAGLEVYDDLRVVHVARPVLADEDGVAGVREAVDPQTVAAAAGAVEETADLVDGDVVGRVRALAGHRPLQADDAVVHLAEVDDLDAEPPSLTV